MGDGYVYTDTGHGGYTVRVDKKGGIVGIVEQSRITGTWKAYKPAGAIVALGLKTRTEAARRLVKAS